MLILVFNGGSSSIKFSLFASKGEEDEADATLVLDGEVSGIGTTQAALSLTSLGGSHQNHPLNGSPTTQQAVAIVLDALKRENAASVTAVGHRVVHPGSELQDHVRITDKVLAQLDAASSLAPLHDPEAVAMIREAMRRLPEVPHFACFDTVFHRTMPAEASTYAIPQKFRDQGVKRYGFHGLSCESVVRQMRQDGPLPERMVIAHLGSGCSVTSVLNGASVDTTMGLTPDGGVIMGTRPGDLDPGLIFYLLRQNSGGDAVSTVEKMLNHEAGMVALTDLPNDMKAVRKAASEGNEAAILALKVFTRSIRKAIGGFAWNMDGLDAVVFTGGIGEHDSATRAEVLAGSEATLDSSLNNGKLHGVNLISASDSKTAVFVVPAQEDLVIALHVKRLLQATA